MLSTGLSQVGTFLYPGNQNGTNLKIKRINLVSLKDQSLFSNLIKRLKPNIKWLEFSPIGGYKK